jgi:hypothetical protein
MLPHEKFLIFGGNSSQFSEDFINKKIEEERELIKQNHSFREQINTVL